MELLVLDTWGTPEGAAEAAALAIGDGARVILGPLLASSVQAVAPAARVASVPVIAFSNDRSVAGDGVFVMGFLPSTEVDAVIGYAHSRGLRRFAILAPDNDYGGAVLAAARYSVETRGAELARVQFYHPGEQDFSEIVRVLADYNSRHEALLAQRRELETMGGEVAGRALARLGNLQTIGDLPFDALLIPEGGKRLQNIAAHLPFYDVDPKKVRILGTGRWDVAGIGAEPALQGGWFAAPPPAARASFEREYRAMYNETPPRLATLAYDATALAAVLARAEGGADFGLEAITAPSGFAGRDGIFRFLPDGEIERGLAIVQVAPKKFKVIQKALDAFATTTH